MDEQRLERALRAGPPFATAYVARPLRLDEKAIMSRPLTLRRTAILLAVLALLLAATIVGALLSGVFRSPMAAIAIRDPGAERSYTISIVHSDGREETIFPQGTGAPVWIDDLALSADGQQLAFTASRRQTTGFDDTGLFVMRSDGSDLRQVIKSLSIGACPWSLAGSMRWAPDRRTLAACIRHDTPGGFTTKLLAIDIVNGTSTILAAGENLSYEWFGPFQWSPNGEWLAYRRQQSGNALWVVRRDGSEARQLAIPADQPPEGAQPEVSAFAWSPASDAIAFGDRQAEKAVIEIVRLDGRRSTITLASLEPDDTTLQVLAWDRPDEIVYLAGGGRSVATMSTDGESGELLLDWNRAGTPPWIAADGRIDLSRMPWLASDGRTLQWWESSEASTCLIAVEGGGVRTQFCTQGAHMYLLALGERR